MAKKLKGLAAAALLAAAAFTLLYRAGLPLLPLAITFGTIAYHLWVRLIIGAVFDAVMGNRADYTRRWYQPRAWEPRLYDVLGVRRWKSKMPTYAPEAFDPAKHSWHEIAQAMCQSELVHETNVLFSLVPVLFSLWFGEAAVFIVTSVLAAAFDLVFVIMQRYNRPTVIRIALRAAKRQNIKTA